MGAYEEFLHNRTHLAGEFGFAPTFIPHGAFDFQVAMIEYAVRKGRAALFEDCGMGKTMQFLAWAQNVVQHTNKPVLVLTPLAVSQQTVREGEKFGIDVRRSADGSVSGDIVVTNYERLQHFNADDFSGVVCDESSILKNFDGARRAEITYFMRKMEYRLLATATAAPNDYIELGTSSEALGHLGHMDMLGRFFKNDQNNVATKRMYGEAPKWRFKGNAQAPFWRWVCSWARAMRSPSDLGFDDGPFVLPPLEETIIELPSPLMDGDFFPHVAANLPEQRAEKKRTIEDRCRIAAETINSHDRPAVAWCHLNEEGKALTDMIDGAVEVSGSDADEAKEEKFLDFIDGKIKRLVTKPSIGAMGLNFQHCADMTDFPSHSYEQYYQSVRRFWRFGQKSTVRVTTIMTEGERRIIQNRKRKADQAAQMFANLVSEMNNAASISGARDFSTKVRVPKWL